MTLIDDMRLILQVAEEKARADGCIGCAFDSIEEWQEPCCKCSRNCKDYWRSKYRCENVGDDNETI